MFTITEIANAIRDEKLSDEAICKRFGGFKIYIPKIVPDFKDKIAKEFNGYNHAVLATKYNISINTVYEVTRNHENNKKHKHTHAQPALF